MGEQLVIPQVDFSGFYEAEVIDDADPADEKSGRVKVRVFPMMVRLEEAVLPWATPAFPLFEGAAADQGSYCVPAKNSRVWVFFAAGDVRSPVYFANAPGKADGPAEREPGKTVFKSRSGHTVTISDVTDDAFVRIETAEGNVVELDDEGDLTIEHKDGEKIVLKNGAVEIGSGTLKKLINELAASILNGHGHEYVAPGTGGSPAVSSTPLTGGIPPTLPNPAANITATEMTSDTKAS